jgi:hypothetical protein
MRQQRGNRPLAIDLPSERLLIEGLDQRQQSVTAFRVLAQDFGIHRLLLSGDTPSRSGLAAGCIPGILPVPGHSGNYQD